MCCHGRTYKLVGIGWVWVVPAALRNLEMMATQRTGRNDDEQEIMFNPAEHTDLAHFFAHVDATETFALTANEWLGIRSGGQQFNPVGSVGPIPNTPSNGALRNATRSLMALKTPVIGGTLPNSQKKQTSVDSAVSVRAWRPHETPFDPAIHGNDLTRRPSSSASSKPGRDRSIDSASRKRPAPHVHAESMPSKRARSVSHSGLNPPGQPVASSSHSAPTLVTSGLHQPNKPPLLTPEQKKANHILSEQKRRAKIRRGYDALCEVVPALRSAILAEQEATAYNPVQDSPNKRKKGKGGTKSSGDGDGRAGPKSESVVLSQSALVWISRRVLRI